MKGDPLLRFLYELRTEILKKGTVPTDSHAHIKRLRIPQDLAKLGSAPPNAKSFFVGDASGGAGWEVQLPNGEIVKYYVELPGDIGEASLHLADAPVEHLGSTLPDRRVETLCNAYIAYLEDLVRAAENHFGGGA